MKRVLRVVRSVGDAGVDAILVGEFLLRSSDPEQEARTMTSILRRERSSG